ncbi:hypothetical protein G9A89_023243 [Geosiphon pyriformis]|nr:hypothetical protein G9A89_023243 [Geosiphon pyriformis]
MPKLSVSSIITQQLMNQLGRQINYAISTKIITTNGMIKIPICKINNFLFKVSDIIMFIKVLIIEITQYQALIGNDWLTKTNAVLN